MDRRRAAGALLALAACIACSAAAPTASNHTALDLYDGAPEGCYYNFQHYGEGDRIMTNEPCLNCTCHNRMLMCYLRVCPFTKPIGQDCTVEKRADQCCPIVTCPDVPVDLLTSTSTSSPAEYGATGLGKLDKYGCSISGKYFPEGSKVPPTPNKPCEHCYCIRNMTTCVMQECTLHVDGCTPIYHKDVCCPVRYSCDHPEDEMPLLDDMSTTVRPTPGFLLTTTTVSPVTQMTQDCVHNDQVIADGASITTEKACEHCYCMKGDIVCVVQECGAPMENEGKNCTSLPPREGQCCPDTYICEGDELSTDITTTSSTDAILETLTTLSPPRRGGVEGSGYRNEPNEAVYTEMPTVESELEGSGEEEGPTKATDTYEPLLPGKPLESEKMTPASEDSEQYIPVTTKAPIFEESETTTKEFDKNYIPGADIEQETIEPQAYIPTTQTPVKEQEEQHEPITGTSAPESYEQLTTESGESLSSVSDVLAVHEEHEKPHEYAPATTSTPTTDETGTMISVETEGAKETPSDKEQEVTQKSVLDESPAGESLTPSPVIPEDTKKETTEKSDVESGHITEKTHSDTESYIDNIVTDAPTVEEIGSVTPKESEDVTFDDILKHKESTQPELNVPSTTSIPIEDIEKLTTEPDHAQNTVAVAEEGYVYPHVPSSEETEKPLTDLEETITEKVPKDDSLDHHERVSTQAPVSEEGETFTVEPDKGLNTIPSEIDEESSSQPSEVDRPTSSAETKTTEPSVITHTTDMQDTDTKSSTSEPLTSSEIHVTKGDQYTITTEPSFRREDEVRITTEKPKEDSTATTIKPEFVDEGLIPTSTHDEKLSTGSDVSSIDEDITTMLPEYSQGLEETIDSKHPTTESFIGTPVTSETTPEKVAETVSQQEGGLSSSTEKSADVTEPLTSDVDIHEEPSRIPGEGDCLLNGVTYRNNTVVPSSNNCHTGCKCVSSIVKCDPIICSPPPDYMDNCQSIYDTPDSCCPTYVCDHPKETIPPQSDNQMSGTEPPMLPPVIECRGDQCELTEPTKQPTEPSDHKPESNVCGPEGCDSASKEPTLESCANGECKLPPSHGQESPIEPCEGDNCKTPGEEITPDGAAPQQDNLQTPCKDGDNCKSDDFTPSDCTGDAPCRRKDTPAEKLPSECKDGDCVPIVDLTDTQSSTLSSIPEPTPFEEVTEKITHGQEEKPTESHVPYIPSEHEKLETTPSTHDDTGKEHVPTQSPAYETTEAEINIDGETQKISDVQDTRTETPSLFEDGTRQPSVIPDEQTSKPVLGEEQQTEKGIEDLVTDKPTGTKDDAEKPTTQEEEIIKVPEMIDQEHTVKEKPTESSDVITDEHTDKPSLVEEEGPTVPDTDTDKPVSIEEGSSKVPDIIEEDQTGKPAIAEENTKLPNVVVEEQTTESVLVEEAGTKIPDVRPEEQTGKPSVVKEEEPKITDGGLEEHTDTSITTEEGTKISDVAEGYTDEPAVIEETGTKAQDIFVEEQTGKPNIDHEESSKVPDSIIEEQTDKPVMIEEVDKNLPELSIEEQTGKPATSEEASTKASYDLVEEQTDKPVIVEELATKMPDVIQEEKTGKPDVIEEEYTTIPGTIEKEQTDKLLPSGEEGTKTPDAEEGNTEEPSEIETGTEIPDIVEQENTEKTALTQEESTKKPDLSVEEHTDKSVATEDGIKVIDDAEGYTDEPVMIEETGTKVPGVAIEEQTSKPSFVEEEDTKTPASEEQTSKPTLGEEEDTKTPASEEQTSKPTLGEEEDTKTPASEEQASKPASGEEEDTKTPASEEQTSKPALGEEEDTKTPTLEEQTSKPALSEEEDTKTPASEEQTSKPALGEEVDTKTPASEEQTSKPALGEEVDTKTPASEEQTSKPASGEEEDTRTPASEEQTSKPALGEEEDTKTPASEDHTSKPALGEEEKIKIPGIIVDEQTIKPTLIEEDSTKIPDVSVEEHTIKSDVAEEGTRKSDITGYTDEPTGVEDTSTKLPDISVEEPTTKSVMVGETGTETADIEADKPVAVEDQYTKIPDISDEKATDKPVSLEEEITKLPDVVSGEHTDKSVATEEEHTKIPDISESEQKPALEGEQTTSKPAVSAEEQTDKPEFSEDSRIPDDEKEITEKPLPSGDDIIKAPDNITGKPDEVKEKPMLEEQELPEKTGLSEDDGITDRPISEVEGTEIPETTEVSDSKKPMVIDESTLSPAELEYSTEAKSPTIIEEESTKTPEIIDDVTKDIPSVEEEGAMKPIITPNLVEKDQTDEPQTSEVYTEAPKPSEDSEHIPQISVDDDTRRTEPHKEVKVPESPAEERPVIDQETTAPIDESQTIATKDDSQTESSLEPIDTKKPEEIMPPQPQSTSEPDVMGHEIVTQSLTEEQKTTEVPQSEPISTETLPMHEGQKETYPSSDHVTMSQEPLTNAHEASKIPEFIATTESVDKITKSTEHEPISEQGEIYTDMPEQDSSVTKSPVNVIIEPQDGEPSVSPDVPVKVSEDEASTTSVYGQDILKPIIPESHVTDTISEDSGSSVVLEPEIVKITESPETLESETPKTELSKPQDTESEQTPTKSSTDEGEQGIITSEPEIFTPEKEEMITSTVISAVTETVKGSTEIEDAYVTGHGDITTEYNVEPTDRLEPSATEKADESSETLTSSSESPIYDTKATTIPEKSYSEGQELSTEAPVLQETQPADNIVSHEPEISTILSVEVPIATESPELSEKIPEEHKPVTGDQDLSSETLDSPTKKPDSVDLAVTELPVPVEIESQEQPIKPVEDVATQEEKTTKLPDSEISTVPVTYVTGEQAATEIPESHISASVVTEQSKVTESSYAEENVTGAEEHVTDAQEQKPADTHRTTTAPEILEEPTGTQDTSKLEHPVEVEKSSTEYPYEEYHTELPDREKSTEAPLSLVTGQQPVTAVMDDNATEKHDTESPLHESQTESKVPISETPDTATSLPGATTSEGIQEITKSSDHTTAQAEFSETTPYLIELEEHTHKIEEDISTTTRTDDEDTFKTAEDITTPSPVAEDHTQKPAHDITTTSLSEDEHKVHEHLSTTLPSTDYTHKASEETSTAQSEGELHKPEIPVTEKITEEEVETTTKQVSGLGDELSTSISDQPTLPPAVPEDTSEKLSESSAPTESIHIQETTIVPAVDQDKYDMKEKDVTTVKSVQDSEGTTPASIDETEKSPVTGSDIPVLPEKETTASQKPLHADGHDASHTTPVPEDELILSTTKATTIKQEEIVTPVHEDKYEKPEDKPISEVIPPSTTAEIPKPPAEMQPTDDISPPDDDGHFPPSGTGYGEPDYVEEDQAFGPGTCRYGGKVYVSAQQIPRDDPCDFCFCFRSDIICLQQSCPPPIHGCHEEPIQGFCCPRYECPVSMATTVNVTTTTTTTTTTLPPHFPTHSYKGAAQRRGCQIKGHTYKVGEVVRSSSGPCLHCTCGGDGQMKCDPKACTPEPMLRQMIAAAVSAKRRR